MGVLLGGFIDGDPATLEGATSYLAFIVPGLVAAHAMQTAVGETTYPVMGTIKWHKTYYSMIATPLEPRHLVAAHLMFVLFRLATACGVFMLVLAPFGVFESWWGPFLAFGSQLLVGMAFARWSTASRTVCSEQALRGAVPPRGAARCSCSPARSSRSPTSARSSSGSPASPRCGTAST